MPACFYAVFLNEEVHGRYMQRRRWKTPFCLSPQGSSPDLILLSDELMAEGATDLVRTVRNLREGKLPIRDGQNR